MNIVGPENASTLHKELRDGLRIAIIVHGRFYAFDLTKALLHRGHDVVLFTNYPCWVTARFGIPKDRVRSFLTHGLGSRFFNWAHNNFGIPYPESWLHSWFGRWAAREVSRQTWDVLYFFSGIAEECFCRPRKLQELRWLARGSAHIRTQDRILAQEEERVGSPIDRPSEWMIERESREYSLADRIVILSHFAQESFVAEGIDKKKLVPIPLGASLEEFRLTPEESRAREVRIRSGLPLRVLYTGTLSCRKGIYDLDNIIRSPRTKAIEFKLVGPATPEVVRVFPRLLKSDIWIPKIPQKDLHSWYAWADLFLFPTLEDGYAIVLAQASEAGLPILATTNCGAPELIQDGKIGWILPIRDPDAFIERLNWCDQHRDELLQMVKLTTQNPKIRTWSDVALDHEKAMRTHLDGMRKSKSCATTLD